MDAQSDQELIDRRNRLIPEARKILADLPGDIIDTDNPIVIEAAWGPRRVSGRTRGMSLYAYPSRVMAARGLWEDWLNKPKPYVGIVIAKKKAQARIDAAMGRTGLDPEMAAPEPLAAITQEEIDDMLAERDELRAARDFVAADKIRDYLTRHGISVADRKV